MNKYKYLLEWYNLDDEIRVDTFDNAKDAFERYREYESYKCSMYVRRLKIRKTKIMTEKELREEAENED